MGGLVRMGVLRGEAVRVLPGTSPLLAGYDIKHGIFPGGGGFK